MGYYEYKGFNISCSSEDWYVYGVTKQTISYGYIGKFETSKEAEAFINRLIEN